ncbi:MAG: trypsin-like peptidase domain-containing protein [Acidimicrobiia bacterium]
MTPEGPEGPPQADEDFYVTYDSDERNDAERERKPVDGWTVVLGIFGGVLLGTGVTFAILGFTGVFTEPTVPTIPPAPTLTAPPPTSPPATFIDSSTVSAVAERAIPSIVTVEVSGFFGTGGGSGVVYGNDGYIVTNSHVVARASSISIVFSDGARFPAEVIGTDPLTDLAVLRVERSDLTSIDIGSSASIDIGQAAIAVGNPLGLAGGPSVTSGIISALNRFLDVEAGTRLYGLIQTDAPITRGSSGGALLDGNARLIGITTAIAVSDVGAEGLGFAVPIDIATGVITDLIEDGQVAHAVLGIQGETAFATSDGAGFPVGVLVTDILGNSAYETAGGQVNDVIISIDALSIDTLDELLTHIRSLRAGEVATMEILRGDAQLELEATMGLLES